MVEVMWFDQEISSFVNFYLVNWTLIANILFLEWQSTYSVNVEWDENMHIREYAKAFR